MTSRPADGRYEHSDANPRPVFLAGAGLGVLLAVSMAVSAWMSLGAEPEQLENPLDALRVAPDSPELQAIPAHELAEHRAWEERMLTGTEWIDPLNQIVRIPVERALELTLQEGFPTRGEEPR